VAQILCSLGVTTPKKLYIVKYCFGSSHSPSDSHATF